jgi:tricorn protease
VSTDRAYAQLGRQEPVWSRDGKWVAYTRTLENRLTAIFIYSLEKTQSMQATDGMSEAEHPVFDKSGKYLFSRRALM